MADPDNFPLEGGCDCKAIRYRMETAPLFVHCCHCRCPVVCHAGRTAGR